MVAYATQQATGRGPTRSQGWSSQEINAYAEITPVTCGTGDTYDMVRVPAGAIITGITLLAEDIDSNGTPTVALSVGDSSSSTRFISSSTIGQAGGFTSTIASGSAAMFFKYTTETAIRVTATTGAATYAAGKIKLHVKYLVEPMFT